MIATLLGCGSAPVPAPVVPEPAPTYELRAPLGPDDPLALTWGGDPVEPIVADADGRLVPVEPFVHPDAGWVARGGWAPGAYTVVGAIETAATADLPFKIGRYGADPLDPQALVGRTWAATEYQSTLAWVVPFAEEPLNAGIAVDSVDAHQVGFWVLGQVGDRWCAALHGYGFLDPTGATLRWSRAELGAPGAIEASDLAITVGWLADPVDAWAVATATVDTRNAWPLVSATPDEDAVCAMVGALGNRCRPCADLEPRCLDLEASAIRLEEIHPIDAAALPSCGLDPEDPDPQLFDCGCATGAPGGLSLLGLVALAARRRHRPKTIEAHAV